MKESEFLGKLLPGPPDILPIIENLRKKYQLSEVASEASSMVERNKTRDWRKPVSCLQDMKNYLLKCDYF